MKKICLIGCALLASLCIQAQTKMIEDIKASKGDLVIPYTRYELSNGLTVLLHEDKSDPIVHVDVTYHVGSAREEIGKSGFAHFFEHMMFQGSDNVADEQHFKIITESGGTLNGTTNKDRTNYFETVPSNQLEKMLWLEADRMGFLLDAVTQKKFEVQRATVKNERGQNYDNRPYGLAGEVTSKHLYPYGHPYSWLTIGYVEDLNRVDVQDLKNFFLRWYGPNNAVITVGGDIDKAQTLKWIEKYFGSIPRGPEVEPVKLAPVSITKDRYETLIDNYAKIPMLSLTMPSVPFYHKDEPALDCLAEILGGGKSSVLYQALVKTQKALNARVGNPCFELAGEFSISVMPKPGTPLADMEKMVRDLINNAGEAITQEKVNRFNQSQEANIIYGLESVSGKVSQLASYYTFTGNANYLGKDIKRYNSVTLEDVKRVYEQYVKNKSMVILSVLPKGMEKLEAAKPNHPIDETNYKAPNYGYDKLTYNKAKDVFDRSKLPNAGNAVSVKVPKVIKKESETRGGAQYKLIMSPSDEIPVVVVQISMKGGRIVEQNDLSKAGLSELFSSMMNDDTKGMSAEQISDKLDEMGSSVSVSTSLDEIIFTVRSLKKNLVPTLDILAERMYNPDFKEEAFSRIKNQTKEGIKNSRTRASAVASEAYDRMLYGPKSILGYPSSGNLETVENITLKDIQNYYQNYVAGNNLKIVIVGDYSNEDEYSILKYCSRLQPKEINITPLPKTESRTNNNTIYVVDIPKAAQSEFRVGYNTGLKYDATGDYYKSNLMNYALGGAFNSRLNLNLREDKGWTYGARSSFYGDDYSGRYTFSSGIKADKTVDAFKEVKKELDLYAKEGIQKEELSFMKSAVSQSDARKYETLFQKAGFLGNMLKRNLELSYVDEQNKVLNNLSKKDLDRLSTQWIDWNKMQVVLAGDLEQFKKEFEALGYKVVKIDAEGTIAP